MRVSLSERENLFVLLLRNASVPSPLSPPQSGPNKCAMLAASDVAFVLFENFARVAQLST